MSPRKTTDAPPQQPPSGNFGKTPGAADKANEAKKDSAAKPTTPENQYIIQSLQSIVSNSSKSSVSDHFLFAFDIVICFLDTNE